MQSSSLLHPLSYAKYLSRHCVTDRELLKEPYITQRSDIINSLWRQTESYKSLVELNLGVGDPVKPVKVMWKRTATRMIKFTLIANGTDFTGVKMRIPTRFACLGCLLRGCFWHKFRSVTAMLTSSTEPVSWTIPTNKLRCVPSALDMRYH